MSLQASGDWLPLLGEKTVVSGEQPQTTRRKPSDGVAKTPFSINHDVLEDMKTVGHSKLSLITLCKELGVKPLPKTRNGLIEAIVQANVPYDEFAAKYFKLGGKSGGIARGFCTHGVVYVMKILVGPEGASDYCQMLTSFQNPPNVIIIDFGPQVAKHMNIVAPGFLTPYGGKILPHTKSNVENVLNGEMVSIPGLLEEEMDDKYILIDPFHRPNHRGADAVLHDPQAVQELKDLRQNLEIQEQRNSLTKKYAHFLNSMSKDRFIKYLMYQSNK